MSWSPVEIQKRFEETYSLHLQGWRVSQASCMQKTWFRYMPSQEPGEKEVGGYMSLWNVTELLPDYMA
jgi:hypothetical protein